MVNKIASFALSCLLLLGAPLAQAGMLTLTFDEDYLQFEGSSADASILNSSPSYGGFAWDARFYLGSTETEGFESAASPGSQFVFNKGNQRRLKISRETPFDFLGASFGFYSLDAAARIKFSAYDPSVSQIVSSGYQSLNTEGVTWLGFSLMGIHELEIDAYGGTFAMDNFSFRDSVVKVTEAGSLALLVIGVIGLWAARRRGQLQA